MKLRPFVLLLCSNFAVAQLTLTARAYRIVPQQNTTYYQTPGTSSTQCYGYGSSTTFGNIASLHGITNCNSSYTNPQQIPITWKYADVYNALDDGKDQYLIACRARWRWSKCSALRPGDKFQADVQGNTVTVVAFKNGDPTKTIQLKYQLMQRSPLQTASPLPSPRLGEQGKSDQVERAAAAISSTPAGADIDVDGSFVGNTPSTIDLLVGPHVVTVTKSGYRPFQRRINITGGNITLNAQLLPQ